MGIHKLLFLRTPFDLFGRAFSVNFLSGDMFRMLCFFWVLLCNFLFFTVGSIRRFLSRRMEKDPIFDLCSRVHADARPKGAEKSSDFYGPEEEKHLNYMSDLVRKSRIDGDKAVLSESLSSKYHFSSSAMIVSFIVEEIFLGSSASTISTPRNLDALMSEESAIGEDFETEEEEDELFHDVDTVLEEDSSLAVNLIDSNLKVRFFKGELLSGDDENQVGSFSDAVISTEIEDEMDNSVEKPIGDGKISGEEQEQSELLSSEGDNFPSQDRIFSSSDDRRDSGLIWEHDDIIEQLKMELKLARNGGLPTIIEETEPESCPDIAIVDDPNPMNTIPEQKLEQKDQILEIQKVYRSYAEKMRQLDVLNYRTMHAIGLLQLKDRLRSNTTQKDRKFLHRRLRKSKIGPESEPMESAYGDLETVYVGHICLSWEILQWQYSKSRELLEFDSVDSYNLVANEFQLFRILLERFMETERFQGPPRVENYAKNRCVRCSLLQVPAVIDDCLIGKKQENAVSSVELAAIIEESIHVLWHFIRSDSDKPNNTQKVYKSNIPGSADSTLVMAIRTRLHKKERRLKDIVRSGNCIAKRLQKDKNRVDLVLQIALVELKLISRVLSMRKLTRDQLVWCRDKLDRTSIVSRKIYVEPSFLLFPC